MPRSSRMAKSHHSIQQIYDLIIDVGSYPEFLPFCTQAEILSFNSNVMVADLHVQVGLFAHKYRSEVHCSPPNSGSASVKIEAVEGPLRYLDSSWILREEGEVLRISFQMDFEFKVSIFNMLIAPRVERLCDTFVASFMNRAGKIYEHDRS